MGDALRDEIRAILAEGKDLTLATLREDGWPQATVVSYASDGEAIYFGCDPHSQKVRNLGRDGRVSVTVTLPYVAWREIRGLSLGGWAHRLADPGEIEHAGALFTARFGSEMQNYVTDEIAAIALFRIDPKVVSILDYRKGFGHTEMMALAEPAVEVPAGPGL